VHEAGCRAGLALTPATPVSAASEVLDDIDLLLCMTVNPGWGGQAFIPASIAKLERLRAMLPPETALEVDGGIDASTAAACAAAGATLFVAGTAVFGAPDPAEAVREIATAAERH
jgi:ribulose-phosphate 3-epimerase